MLRAVNAVERPAMRLIALCFALAATAALAEPLEIPGAASARIALAPHAERIRAETGVDLEILPVGTGQAMLDLIDGKTDAAVVTVPLVEAVAAAREAAWAEGRMLKLPPLAWRAIDGVPEAALVTRPDR